MVRTGSNMALIVILRFRRKSNEGSFPMITSWFLSLLNKLNCNEFGRQVSGNHYDCFQNFSWTTCVSSTAKKTLAIHEIDLNAGN